MPRSFIITTNDNAFKLSVDGQVTIFHKANALFATMPNNSNRIWIKCAGVDSAATYIEYGTDTVSVNGNSSHPSRDTLLDTLSEACFDTGLL